jgi:Na+-translocating ferredoxin:NAD+ oxidoreductase RnfC subunit
MMDIVDKIKKAGVVGAGGAGFPTHVKVSCKADVVIANGAECEPLLRVDQLIMQKYAKQIVQAMMLVMAQTGAKKGIICLKKHYHDAVTELEKHITDKIEIMLLDGYYPAGDEQQMVYEVTGKVVPTGGLPLDVGAVVINVSTLLNITNAMAGGVVTDKHVSVVGEVNKPITIKVPIGTSYRKLIKMADGPEDDSEYTLIIGGPCMGKLSNDWDDVVTKTTGGIIVLPNAHFLVGMKKDNYRRDVKLAKAVCCQCSLCTQLCPRNSMGLNVEPHKAMRAIAQEKGDLLSEVNGVFSCCDCGLCTYFACNFGLNPSAMMTRIKGELLKQGVKPKKEVYGNVDSDIDLKKVPVKRLMARLGVSKYSKDTPLIEENFEVNSVKIPLKMHIGAPCEARVAEKTMVNKGDLIADTDKLGASIHASIDGVVTNVTNEYIEIVRRV